MAQILARIYSQISSGHNLAKIERGGGVGGQVVSVLPFYLHDPSLNPAEVIYFVCVKKYLKRLKRGRQ